MATRIGRWAVVCAVAGGLAFTALAAAAPEGALAVVDVSVVPMDRNVVLRHQTVVVERGRVTYVGPAATARVPRGARVIPGAGRYLLPGLIDMHVHLQRADLPRYLAAGITTVRNMWGTPGVRRLQADVASGAERGPTILSASPGLDGTPPQWPGTVAVLDSASAGAAVQAQAAAGWSWIKVYTQLTPPAYHAIMAAARVAGIPVIGHVPLRVDVHDALRLGQHSIEHFTGYDRAVSRTGRSGTWGWSDADSSRYPELVAATLAAGAWNCPTLAIFVQLAQQHPAAERPRIIGNRRQFVRALSAAGAHLLAGTDAGIDIVAPGTSLHDELAEFVAAGLTPYQALRAATVDAAAFLDRPELGRVAVGGAADLILVSANPLEDVRRAAAIEGMALHGEWLTPAEGAGRPADVAGDYDTAVTLGVNSCGAVSVAPQLTSVAQRPGDSTFTLRHGPLTYHGWVDGAGRFRTDTQSVAVDGGRAAVAVTGTFRRDGFVARAAVWMRTATPCAYQVAWVGTRRGS